MQKKIIALAIASALAMPAVAMADGDNVVIYGDANVSYDLVRTGGNNGVTVPKVSSNDSKFGFKGAEDLGDGLSAFWQVESVIDFDSGGNGGGNGHFANRDTFAGLAGSGWGSVAFGANGTAYKRTTRGWDQFGYTIADNRAIMGGGSFGTPVGSGLVGQGAGFDDGINNHIFYTSPNVNGFTGIVDYSTTTLGESRINSTNPLTPKTTFFAAGANYDAGPLGLVVAYAKDSIDNVLGFNFDSHAIKFGAQYTMDAFNFGAIYEKISDDSVFQQTHNDYYLFGKYTFGTDAIKAAYTHAGSQDFASNTGAKQYTFGYDHNLSKRTTLYALYTKLSNDTGAAYTFSPLGPTGTSVANGLGASPSAISVGMKHTF
ncbi:MAG TPA: porin [Gallionella sp.]|nr:porin [Gallionella sp.]